MYVTKFLFVILLVGLVVIIIASTSSLVRGYEPDNNDIDRINGAAVGAITWTTKKPRGW